MRPNSPIGMDRSRYHILSSVKKCVIQLSMKHERGNSAYIPVALLVTEAIEREVFVISFDVLVSIGICVEVFLFLLLNTHCM